LKIIFTSIFLLLIASLLFNPFIKTEILFDFFIQLLLSLLLFPLEGYGSLFFFNSPPDFLKTLGEGTFIAHITCKPSDKEETTEEVLPNEDHVAQMQRDERVQENDEEGRDL